MFHTIREEFRACHRSSGGSAKTAGTVTAAELAAYWQKLTEDEQQKSGNGLLSQQDKQVIKLRVSQLMQEMDIKRTGRIGMEEWVHYMLLAQSGRVATQINSLLRVALVQQPQVLKDLQRLFEVADMQENGLLTFKSVMESYSKKLWHLRPGGNDGRLMSGQELDEKAPEKLARQIIEEMDLDGDQNISYAEFMAYCVGRRKSEVTLHLYDISHGAAQKVSPWLVSKQLEGLWHSGICVFGKEYFFSRDTVFDEAGATSFGKPEKVLHLGTTLWRQSELHKFIVDDLKPVFHRGTYDIIDNNCNHFTNRVSQYLLGKALPDEVLEQPACLKSSAAVRTLRPILNWWLRDGVVTRGNDQEIQAQSENRPKIDKPLRPGTVVKIYPADGEAGQPVLGMVTSPDGQVISSLLAKEGPITPRWTNFCGCAYMPSAREVCDKSCVQYFDLQFDSAAGSCHGQLRTEMMPHSRLTVEQLHELKGFL